MLLEGLTFLYLSHFYNVHWVTGLWNISEENKCLHRVGDMHQGRNAFSNPAASSCAIVFIQLNVWHRVRSAFIVCGTERPGLDSNFSWNSVSLSKDLSYGPKGCLHPRSIELKQAWSPCHAPHSWLPPAWAPAWTLPSEMLRNQDPGSNLGNWLEATVLEQKEERMLKKCYIEKQGGNIGLERRGN